MQLLPVVTHGLEVNLGLDWGLTMQLRRILAAAAGVAIVWINVQVAVESRRERRVGAVYWSAALALMIWLALVYLSNAAGP